MTYTLESLAAELPTLQLDRFDYEIAWKLGCLMQSVAAANKLPVGISVAHGADLVFSLLMPGATPDNSAWMAGKRASVTRFHRSSLALRLEAEAGGYDFNTRFRLPTADYVASGGAIPLILRGGTLIGSAAVSGLPDTEDHRIVADAIRKLLA